MKNYVVFVFLIVLVFIFPLQVMGIPIVDTGTPASSGGWLLSDRQWLSAEFSLDQSYSLTDIQGYFNNVIGSLTVVVYADGGDVPDINNELFSGTLTTSSAGWNGLSGLDWFLLAGDYWVAFEVRSGNTFSGGMLKESPNPLANEANAYMSSEVVNYSSADSLDIGVRIAGNSVTSPVPEPSTTLLLCAGLAGLAVIRRRRGKNK